MWGPRLAGATHVVRAERSRVFARDTLAACAAHGATAIPKRPIVLYSGMRKDRDKVSVSSSTGDVKRVLTALARAYPRADCALHYATPEQLLIATILSAQCTDERVNQVTGPLFAQYPTPADLAQLPVAELERRIQPTGFFRNKAKNIRACCQVLVEKYGGHVPRSLDELVALPGVGRKTANVVLGTAFGMATGVVVDTHVGRITQRLGLTTHEHPERIERDLMATIPKRSWILFSHRLIHHGRQVCKARKPSCHDCCLARWCPRIGVASSP